MDNNNCPRCTSETNHTILYKCIQCLTVYCQKCENTDGGRICPKCGMSQRMLLTLKNK